MLSKTFAGKSTIKLFSHVLMKLEVFILKSIKGKDSNLLLAKAIKKLVLLSKFKVGIYLRLFLNKIAEQEVVLLKSNTGK